MCKEVESKVDSDARHRVSRQDFNVKHTVQCMEPALRVMSELSGLRILILHHVDTDQITSPKGDLMSSNDNMQC